MENWRAFRLVEDATDPLDLLLEGQDPASELANLKSSPQSAQKLVQQALEEKDKKKLAQLARILMTDPEIKAAAEVISLIPAEVEKAEKEEPDLTEIDFLDRGFTATTGAVGRVLEKPGVKKILGLTGATILLGALVAALIPGAEASGLDPQMINMLFGVGGTALRCAAATDGTDCLTSIIGATAEEAAGVQTESTHITEQERKKA